MSGRLDGSGAGKVEMICGSISNNNATGAGHGVKVEGGATFEATGTTINRNVLPQVRIQLAVSL
jgi:hypothetical protein